eukprot:scaffold261_cov336-Pavlova_lutheri.AAC.49
MQQTASERPRGTRIVARLLVCSTISDMDGMTEARIPPAACEMGFSLRLLLPGSIRKTCTVPRSLSAAKNDTCAPGGPNARERILHV